MSRELAGVSSWRGVGGRRGAGGIYATGTVAWGVDSFRAVVREARQGDRVVWEFLA